MTLVTATNSAELSRRSRFFAAIVGAGLLAVLLLASQLRPDARGWGTHEQLGLPPCTFLAVSGKRCPACGMTTAWANLTHGRLVDALAGHTSGTLLALVALAAAVIAWAMAARGRYPVWIARDAFVAGLAVALAGLIVCEWIVRMLLE